MHRRRPPNNAFDDDRSSTSTRRSTATCASLRRDGADLVDDRHAELHRRRRSPRPPPASRRSTPGRVVRLHPTRRRFGVAPIAIGDEEIINFNVPPFVYDGRTCDHGRGRLQRLPHRRRRRRPTTTSAATCPTDPTRRDRTTSWHRSGPTSTAPSAQGIWAAVAHRRRRQLDRGRVAGERLRHDDQPALPGLDRASTGSQDITFAYARQPAGRSGRAATSSSGPRTGSARATWRPSCPPTDLRVTSTDPRPGRHGVLHASIAEGQRPGIGPGDQRDAERRSSPARRSSTPTSTVRPGRPARGRLPAPCTLGIGRAGGRLSPSRTAAFGCSQRNSGSPPWYS